MRPNVEREWDATARDVRLIYESPVPLNEEQRKLLMALQNPKCRYAVVEGPPGTGKSHSITALVFDAIMNGKSVLVLSDKMEALDVVEDKLSQALNDVRPGDDFQNPILRLGRQSGTYAKILRKGTRDRIQTHYHAAAPILKRSRKKAQEQTEKLRQDINKTVDCLSSVDMEKLTRYERLIKALGLSEFESMPKSDDLGNTLANSLGILNGLEDSAREEILTLLAATQDDADRLTSALRQRLFEARVRESEGAELALLAEFESIRLEHVTWLKNVLIEFKDLRSPIFGYLFKRDEKKALQSALDKRMPLSGIQPPHKRVSKLMDAADVMISIRNEAQAAALTDKQLQESFGRLAKGPVKTAMPDTVLNLPALVSSVNRGGASVFEALLGTVPSLTDWIRFDASLKDTVEKVIELLGLHEAVARAFEALPPLDLQKTQAELQQRQAFELAHKLDGNVIDFVTNKGALATTLRSLIAKKQPFPSDRFGDLKKAFPCIIAGIREFADYIPLEPGIVDLVVIDEASQVSIGQALPALLRGKQIVVLGDEQQFANVKTSTASRAVNQEYVNELEAVFVKNFAVDAEKLERMRNFDVRTSILRFFDLIKHFDVMLKKHFRGYAELISFSSRYFYDRQLQAIRIRAIPVGDVLRFSVVEFTGGPELRNANEAECVFIEEELDALLEEEDPPSVGVITPFREQQKLLTRALHFDSENSEDYKERLRLKVMTFDSCQGEERDRIYYSMVATENHDRLNYIFPPEMGNYYDGNDKLKAQRLNVGYSRARERIHFVLSKPASAYKGTTREVLKHYQRELENAAKLPSVDEVDPNSPMEAKLLGWLQQTAFFAEYASQIEVVPQFPIGDYLRQLDPYYEHPGYRVDFLVLFTHSTGKKVPIVI
ncbi:MAG: AAA family ATPase, partial [Rhodothermales bacterium]|nr:AAA family ATPase [Rhodothermales bacterium]